MAYTTITYNGITLEVLSITPAKKQKTKKSVVGKSLVEINIIGLNAQQWELRVTGVITSDIDTTRTALEESDDCLPHMYSDGLRTGEFYIVPNSLQFTDDGNDVGNIARFSMTLVEE